MQVVQAVTTRAQAREKLSVVYFEADARPVVTAARDCIHSGWHLLHHPLYGNYRPYQQPYRSLLLKAPAVFAAAVSPDETSLHLIEEALLVYGSVTPLAPEKAPASLQDACAMLDCELMRLPLEQAGVLRPGFDFPAREALSRNCA